jgi:hypothetical protein
MTTGYHAARERLAYLQGYVKALTSCGYWAPEVFSERVALAKQDLEAQALLVASMEPSGDSGEA